MKNTYADDKALGILRTKIGGIIPGIHCRYCGSEIKVAIFKGGDYCSDNCRKALGKFTK